MHQKIVFPNDLETLSPLIGGRLYQIFLTGGRFFHDKHEVAESNRFCLIRFSDKHKTITHLAIDFTSIPLFQNTPANFDKITFDKPNNSEKINFRRYRTAIELSNFYTIKSIGFYYNEIAWGEDKVLYPYFNALEIIDTQDNFLLINRNDMPGSFVISLNSTGWRNSVIEDKVTHFVICHEN